MEPSREQVVAGQAVYTPRLLSICDILVLGISNRFIWKCPSPGIERHYNTNVSANHLWMGSRCGSWAA